MSPTSIGGGYHFPKQAASISPASLKRHSGKIFFLHSEKNLEIEGRYNKGENRRN